MAEAKPLRRDATGFAEFGATDTFPATSLPARLTISPSQITADQDNYNPTGWDTADIVRLNFDTGGRAITGFAAWTNGRPKTLFNISGNYGYLPCEHPDSAAANRIMGASDHIIPPYGAVLVEYDGTSSRVRVLSNSFSPAGLGIGNLRGHFYTMMPGSVTAGDWGDFAFAAASSGVTTATAGTSTLPGCIALGTSTSASAASCIYFSKNILNPTYFGSAHLIASCMVHFPTLSDGTNTYVFSFGFIPSPNSTTLNVNNSVCIRYGSAVNSGKFEGFSRANGGTESVLDSGITVAANTVYLLTVCFDKAISEARFYVNGSMVGRVTGNMPTGSAVGIRSIIVKSAGTTARTANVANMMLSTVY